MTEIERHEQAIKKCLHWLEIGWADTPNLTREMEKDCLRALEWHEKQIEKLKKDREQRSKALEQD